MNLVTSPVLAGLLPGGGEWIWLFVIILLLFGGAKLPSLAKGLGQSIREFKKASKEEDEKPGETKPPDARTTPTTTKTDGTP